MLSTTSILSLDQGKLFPQPKTDDAYYARYTRKGTPDAPEPARHCWRFWRLQWHGLSAVTAK